MSDTKKIWTGSLTMGTLIIDENYGFSEISIVLTSGTGTVEGNELSANGIVSTPIALTVGMGINFNTGSNTILDYVRITTTGTVLILGR
jgi:hypothetical protein